MNVSRQLKLRELVFITKSGETEQHTLCTHNNFKGEVILSFPNCYSEIQALQFYGPINYAKLY